MGLAIKYEFCMHGMVLRFLGSVTYSADYSEIGKIWPVYMCTSWSQGDSNAFGVLLVGAVTVNFHFEKSWCLFFLHQISEPLQLAESFAKGKLLHSPPRQDFVHSLGAAIIVACDWDTPLRWWWRLWMHARGHLYWRAFSLHYMPTCSTITA